MLGTCTPGNKQKLDSISSFCEAYDPSAPLEVSKLNTFPIPTAAPAEAIVAAPAPIDFAPSNISNGEKLATLFHSRFFVLVASKPRSFSLGHLT
ncbi:hypothetical protein QL285_021845 [Trifolium repens]|nr:hypothetical protein QL285_021845 [Trifolium repens]